MMLKQLVGIYKTCPKKQYFRWQRTAFPGYAGHCNVKLHCWARQGQFLLKFSPHNLCMECTIRENSRNLGCRYHPWFTMQTISRCHYRRRMGYEWFEDLSRNNPSRYIVELWKFLIFPRSRTGWYQREKARHYQLRQAKVHFNSSHVRPGPSQHSNGRVHQTYGSRYDLQLGFS